VSTLLITNTPLEEGEISGLKGVQVDVINWFEAASVKVADYEVVILDTRLSPRKEYERLFDSMQDEINTLLKAGGVVLVLAGPNVEVRSGEGPRRTHWHETNYDFLPSDFLTNTNLDSSPSRIGSHYDADSRWSGYFDFAPRYWKIVQGISKGEHGPEFPYFRGGRVVERAQLLATTKATSQNVGCLVSWAGGTIGILPPPDKLYVPILFLVERASDIYQQNVEQTRELLKPPSWIEDFKVQGQKRLEKEESELKEKLQEYKREVDLMFLATSALFSTGKQLERAVAKIFSDLHWKVDDLTKEGKPIDYVVHGQKGISDGLLVALTGSTSYIDANHKKLAQLFGALADVEDDQKLVFLVNALANEDPRSRGLDKCITDPALRRMEKHGICILLVPDLYSLWRDNLEGKRSPDQIFQQIYCTSGVFRYQSA
jgi:predicted Holliday junction resolvase-like endonuclease